jgi:hypothetical protein
MLSKISVEKENGRFIFFVEFYTFAEIMGREERIATKTSVGEDTSVGVLYDEAEELTVIGLCPPDRLEAYFEETVHDYEDNGIEPSSIKSVVLFDLTQKELRELESEDIDLAAAALQKKLKKRAGPGN